MFCCVIDEAAQLLGCHISITRRVELCVSLCDLVCVSADDLLEYLSEAMEALHFVSISERSCRIIAV